MFEKIKDVLDNQDNGGSNSFRDILKFKTGNNYVVRLLPNVKDINNTFFHYFAFGWESVATGQYVSALSPVTFGERCPINELRTKLYRSKNADDQELAKLIKRQERWMVNCYVVDNPTDAETEGEIKILRYGKQIDKIIKEAISGDDADEYGPAIFDLSKDGCNFRIKCEENEGGYPTYVSSRFLKPSAIPGVDEDKADEIYNSIYDLSKVQPVKTWDELQEMIDVHLLNRTTTSVSVPDTTVVASAPAPKAVKEKEMEFDEDIPMGDTVEDSSDDEIDDIDELLKDL